MFSPRSRVAAPFVVTGLIAAGALAPTLRAGASPHLPTVSAADLVSKVMNERVSHFSGDFEWSAKLGLPSLSGLTSGGGQAVSTGSGFDLTTLVSGTHHFEVWVNGSEQRIAAPGSLSESDVVHRGNQAWVFDSSTNHVTRYVFDRRADRAAASRPASPLDEATVTKVADQLLAKAHSIGTAVSVSRPVSVAGRSAYLLRLAPDRNVAANRASTVGDATIAVDATTGLPLQVSIYAIGQSAPALRIGFTSISYAKPGASIFAAPKAQTTSTKVVSAPALGGHRAHLRHSPSAAPGWHGYAPRTGSSYGARPTVGADWGTIASFPSAQLTAGSSARELDSVTTVISGSWGSGRLLTTTLVNALFVNGGKVYVGAVTPAALEAAAAPSH